MLTELILSAVICAAVIIGIWLLRGVLLTPVVHGRNQRMTVEITVSGSSPELENTVNGLLWLAENGTLRADIVITNNGMDEDTRKAAGLLAKTNERVSVKEWGRTTGT